MTVVVTHMRMMREERERCLKAGEVSENGSEELE
jgi:hypothetical protein